MLIYGIDPGYTGAITLYWPATGDIEIHDMPTLTNPKGKAVLDMHGILQILEPEGDGQRIAFIEQVSAMPGQGVSSVFRFGEQFGALQMALAATKTPTHYVTPAVWKRHFGLTRDKGVSRGLAMQRFPAYADKFKRVKDDGRAESTLIALYGKETMR
jgi:crossover junction endodeoxyribonuclease RuvC